jgi:hypothetical protein
MRALCLHARSKNLDLPFSRQGWSITRELRRQSRDDARWRYLSRVTPQDKGKGGHWVIW